MSVISVSGIFSGEAREERLLKFDRQLKAEMKRFTLQLQ